MSDVNNSIYIVDGVIRLMNSVYLGQVEGVPSLDLQLIDRLRKGNNKDGETVNVFTTFYTECEMIDFKEEWCFSTYSNGKIIAMLHWEIIQILDYTHDRELVGYLKHTMRRFEDIMTERNRLIGHYAYHFREPVKTDAFGFEFYTSVNVPLDELSYNFKDYEQLIKDVMDAKVKYKIG